MKRIASFSGLILVISMALVNLLNYSISLIIGRSLDPASFAEYHIIATSVLVIAFIGVAVQMIAAKVAAASNGAAIHAWLKKSLFKASLGLLAVMILSSGAIAQFLQFESSVPFILLSLGTPFYLLLCFNRGILQGRQHFTQFAMTFLVETLVRLASTSFIIILVKDGEYLMEWLTISFVLSFIISALFTLRQQVDNEKSGSDQQPLELRPLITFICFMACYELSQIVISHSDVLLAKHYLSADQAGMYSAISLIGRMIYYGTWTFVMMLFPKVIEAQERSENTNGLLLLTTGIVLIIGLSATLFSYVYGDFLLNLLFGQAYAGAGHHLYFYAMATTLFAVANVIVYYYLSLEDYMPVFLSLLFGGLQIFAITLFHASIAEIITVQLFLMMSFLICLSMYHLVFRSLLQRYYTVRHILNGQIKLQEGEFPTAYQLVD